jgi:LacI family transcriptional regulator
VDGLIIVPSEDCSEQLEALIEAGMPIVLIDRYFPGINTNYVVLDNHMATYSAAKLFISNGYKKIGLIAYKSSLIHMHERIRGYCEAMQENGLAEEIIVKELPYNNIKVEMDRVMSELHGQEKPDALIFATNNLTVSGLYTIRKLNIHVPDDQAIIGFDEHEVYDFFQPPLTYIHQPLEEMGRESVKLLLDQIQGSKKIERVRLKHELVIRASSG